MDNSKLKSTILKICEEAPKSPLIRTGLIAPHPLDYNDCFRYSIEVLEKAISLYPTMLPHEITKLQWLFDISKDLDALKHEIIEAHASFRFAQKAKGPIDLKVFPS